MHLYFTWTHPKHQRTRTLIKHKSNRFFIRIWSLLLHFTRQQGKRYDITYESFIHIEWILIPRGEVHIKTEAMRKWHQIYIPKSQNCLTQLPLTAETSGSLQWKFRRAYTNSCTTSAISDLNHSNQNSCFQNAIRRLI